MEIDINGLYTKDWPYMILLCWKRVNVLIDADYDELNTYLECNDDLAFR
jgi:hypothetical protein